jgi:hypothetical protein
MKYSLLSPPPPSGKKRRTLYYSKRTEPLTTVFSLGSTSRDNSDIISPLRLTLELQNDTFYLELYPNDDLLHPELDLTVFVNTGQVEEKLDNTEGEEKTGQSYNDKDHVESTRNSDQSIATESGSTNDSPTMTQSGKAVARGFRGQVFSRSSFDDQLERGSFGWSYIVDPIASVQPIGTASLTFWEDGEFAGPSAHQDLVDMVHSDQQVEGETKHALLFDHFHNPVCEGYILAHGTRFILQPRHVFNLFHPLTKRSDSEVGSSTNTVVYVDMPTKASAATEEHTETTDRHNKSDSAQHKKCSFDDSDINQMLMQELRDHVATENEGHFSKRAAPGCPTTQRIAYIVRIKYEL